MNMENAVLVQAALDGDTAGAAESLDDGADVNATKRDVAVIQGCFCKVELYIDLSTCLYFLGRVQQH